MAAAAGHLLLLMWQAEEYFAENMFRELGSVHDFGSALVWSQGREVLLTTAVAI